LVKFAVALPASHNVVISCLVDLAFEMGLRTLLNVVYTPCITSSA